MLIKPNITAFSVHLALATGDNTINKLKTLQSDFERIISQAIQCIDNAFNTPAESKQAFDKTGIKNRPLRSGAMSGKIYNDFLYLIRLYKQYFIIKKLARQVKKIKKFVKPHVRARMCRKSLNTHPL